MVVHQNITNLAGYFHFLNVRKIPYVIRKSHFPKGVSLASVTQDEIIAAMCRLNWRPSNGLGFKTPYEVFLEDANTQELGVAL